MNSSIDHPLVALIPYPTVSNSGELRNGYLLSQSKYCLSRCKKCAFASNISPTLGPVSYFTCPYGFTVATALVGDIAIRVNGVIETVSNTSTPKFKRENKDRKLKAPIFEALIRSLHDAVPLYEKAVESKAVESIHSFHDIKAIIGTVLHTSEEWLYDFEGDKLDDKINNAPTELVTIYHSCSVLQSLLQMTDILANPNSAIFGQPTPTKVYGTFFLLRKVFESRAKKQNHSITLKGSSYNTPLLYRSFMIIPSILVDNAIKYSESRKKIFITVQDKSNSIYVEVKSYGTLIPEESRKDIFAKGFRGPNSKEKGYGLGLYLAKTVASANGFEIKYKAIPIKGINKGWNCFSFEITHDAPQHS